MRKDHVPVEYLRECFSVDDSGRLLWKARPAAHFRRPKRAPLEGACAGRVNDGGYIVVTLTYERAAYKLFAHRIVWALVHGAWPNNCIDHVNHDKTDNRPSNLRDVTHAQNMRNRKGGVRREPAPLPGAYPTASGFSSQIHTGGRTVYLGHFKTATEANQVFNEARAAKARGE